MALCVTYLRECSTGVIYLVSASCVRIVWECVILMMEIACVYFYCGAACVDGPVRLMLIGDGPGCEEPLHVLRGWLLALKRESYDQVCRLITPCGCCCMEMLHSVVFVSLRFSRAIMLHAFICVYICASAFYQSGNALLLDLCVSAI